jgi:hypothetical protein
MPWEEITDLSDRTINCKTQEAIVFNFVLPLSINTFKSVKSTPKADNVIQIKQN